MTLRIQDPDETYDGQAIEDQFEVIVDAAVHDAVDIGEDVDLDSMEQTLEHYLESVREWQEDGLPEKFSE